MRSLLHSIYRILDLPFWKCYYPFDIVKNIGSPGFAVKGAGFGGGSGAKGATLTPKSGYLPRKFPKSQNIISVLCSSTAIPKKGLNYDHKSDSPNLYRRYCRTAH